MSTEALRLQNEAFWIKHGRQSTQLEDLRRSLEQLSDATADAELQGAFRNAWSGWAS